MRNKFGFWGFITLALLVAAGWFWHMGEERRLPSAPKPALAETNAVKAAVTNAVTATNAASAARTSYRVSNTHAGMAELLRNDHAILLRNALIDTTKPLQLDIPEALRAHGAPGSYLVQSDRPLDAGFYQALAGAGARYVSYIPNNAALVEATAEQAAAVERSMPWASLLPYEPYYKLDSALLPLAVNGQSLTNQALGITVGPGQESAALADIANFHWSLIGQDRTPFGPRFVVEVGAGDLAKAAQWPLAQEIEAYHRRQPLNDLTRVRLGVSVDTLTNTPSYLGLTGTNIWMSLNDTGVDATHPDLTGRISGVTVDNDGHGTHVAGIMVGDGLESFTIGTNPPPGSVQGADFRGEAPQANLIVQQVDLLLGPFISDEFLETNGWAGLEAAASAHPGGVTNGFISNNSWGTGATAYDMDAASFDEAVRDSQPAERGEQAMTYVFAAGNSGDGSGNGVDGTPNTISSPGTAKNVITVGAIESPRVITNMVSTDCQITNAFFLNSTAVSNRVAYFSSCGNVGVGTEGTFGRFKPDVVAPGAFIVSARSISFVEPTFAEFVNENLVLGQTVLPGQTNQYLMVVPDDSALGYFPDFAVIQTTPNQFSPNPFPDLAIEAEQVGQTTVFSNLSPLFVFTPTTNEWLISVIAPPGAIHPVSFDLSTFVVETNPLCDYFIVLSQLDAPLQPWYRYESGTSMAAPAVSGMLGLMQQFLLTNANLSPSPALLKALLINGARSLSGLYDFNTSPSAANEQGWGLPNIANSIPQSLTTANPSLLYVEQSTNDALSTGQSRTYTVDFDTNADPFVNIFPLRVTLVWTDPPGDPAAGVALVNDLDLTVTDSSSSNSLTGNPGVNEWIGNDFPPEFIFTQVSDPANPDASDAVNNVENVYISTADTDLVPPFTITVRARRVNVNAVTTQTNTIKQDYALVVSSDDPELSTPLTIVPNATVSQLTRNITVASNNTALVHQRVGANSPYDYNFSTGATNGTLDQWHFFIFTNDTFATTGTNFTNVIFVTFLPPNLSIPRTTGADIDLYASTNSALTNLDPLALSNALASNGRGGTEFVYFSNSLPNQVYYIGVKAEDQQASDFDFLGMAELNAPSSEDQNGVTAVGNPLPAPIPDGLPNLPGAVDVIAVVTQPITIRHVNVTNGVVHQNPGDLNGTLTLNGATPVTLNNHTGSAPGFFTNFDDQIESGTGRPTDHPGSLSDYITQQATGVWRLHEIDNALGQTGAVTSLTIHIEKQPPQTGLVDVLAPGQSYFGFVVLPNDVTELGITNVWSGGSGSVSVTVTNSSDLTFAYVTNGTASPFIVSLTNNNTPPPPQVTGGTWFYLVQNNTTVPVDIYVGFLENLTPNWVQTFSNNTPSTLLTDATTSSQICINTGVYQQQVVSLDVGVRLDDPDLDNLALRLTSPQGTTALLFENRGGPSDNATNLGLDLPGANHYIYTTFTDDTNLTQTLIKFAPPPYASINYVSNILTSTSFDPASAVGTYTAGALAPGGWTVATNQVGVMADKVNAHSGTNFLALTTGTLTQTFNTVPGNTYELIFYERGPGITDWWPGEENANDTIGPNNATADTTTNYVDGKVGRAFNFTGAQEIDFNTTVGNFNSSDFTCEFWMKMNQTRAVKEAIIDKRPLCQCCSMFDVRTDAIDDFNPTIIGDAACTGFNGADSKANVNDGKYHHATMTRQGPTVTYYIDGVLDTQTTAGAIANINNASMFRFGNSVCVGHDGTVQYSGILDEVSLYGRALSRAEALAIYKADSVGKYSTNSLYANMTVSVDGISTNLIVNQNNSTNWVAVTNIFVATSVKTKIELVGNSALSMLLDDVSVQTLPSTNYNNYFQAEESLLPFVGQDPVGCWTLDVWDTRLDAPANAVLKSWTLDMTFSSTNIDLIVLTNHVADTNVVAANGFRYFAFDVPATANFVTNTLTNTVATGAPDGPLNLIFNQNSLPTGGSTGDFNIVPAVAPSGPAGVGVLTNSGGPPPLIPGQRYFLAVQNTNTVAETFVIQADTEVVVLPAIALLTNTVTASTNVPKNFGPQYFSYDMPANAILASFQILNAVNGEVDLYASYGLPLPNPANYAYSGVSAGATNQAIVVTTNSSPVPLSGGTWYLAAYNRQNTATLNYQILVTVITNIADLTIIDLTNGIPYTNSAPPGFAGNLFYRYTITDKPSAVQFYLTNTSGSNNIDLLIGLNQLPTPWQSYAASLNLGAARDFVQLGTNSTFPSFSNTVWYLAVPNESTNSTSYQIMATNLVAVTLFTNFPAIAQATPSVHQGFTFSWNAIPGTTYEVDISTNNMQSWFQAVQFTATATNASFTDFDFTKTNRDPARFYRLHTVPLPP